LLATAASRNKKRAKIFTARVLVSVLLAVDLVGLSLLGPGVSYSVTNFQFPCSDAPVLFALLARSALVALWVLPFGHRLGIAAHFACTSTGIGYTTSQLVEVARNSSIACPPQRPPLAEVPFVAVLGWGIATGALQICALALLHRHKAAIWQRQQTPRQPRGCHAARPTHRKEGSEASAGSLTTKLLEDHVAATDSDVASECSYGCCCIFFPAA
jgi:hypothetical protein